MVDSSSANYEQMSATLLSQMPVTAAPKAKNVNGWDRMYKHLENRRGQLYTWRYSWWAHWSRLAEYFSPRRYLWIPVANRTWRGNPINEAIIDSTGLQALRTCAAGMWSGMTNPSYPWFEMSIALSWMKLDAAAQNWLENSTKKVTTVLGQSNFYEVMRQAFEDTALIGQAPVIVYEDYEDVVRFYLPVAGEYYLGVGARFSVDTLYREFTLTILQIVEMFGVENVPEEIQVMWENAGASLDSEMVVCHAIEPNFAVGRKNGAPLVPDNFTYREVYWLKGNKGTGPLSARGFNTPPFAVFGWSRSSNDAYYRSPCMDALGDNKQVQRETLRKAEFIEKGVRPPMGASAQMKNEPASIQPAHITYVTADQYGKGFYPLFEPNPAWLGGITADIELVNQRLQKCLFVDVFMAITQMEGVQPRNELELTQRNLERLQAIGPVINQTENALSQIIQRVLDIMIRRRLIDPMPPSLAGIPLKISFTSIMSMAMRASEAVKVKDTLATAGSLQEAAQAAGLPSPIRIFDLDKTMREYAESQGFPISCILTEDVVAQNDQAHAKAMQQAQAPQNIMAAVQAAQGLSKTSMAPGSALSALTGGGGGGP